MWRRFSLRVSGCPAASIIYRNSNQWSTGKSFQFILFPFHFCISQYTIALQFCLFISHLICHILTFRMSHLTFPISHFAFSFHSSHFKWISACTIFIEILLNRSYGKKNLSSEKNLRCVSSWSEQAFPSNDSPTKRSNCQVSKFVIAVSLPLTPLSW